MFKHRNVASLALALALLAAPSVRAAETEVRQVRGNTAEAAFVSHYDCGHRSIDVAVMDHVVKTDSGAPADESRVLVYIQEYDTCLEVSKEYFGYAPLLQGEFSQTSLNAATLTKTVTVCDNTDACRDIMIDLDWTGYGETTGSRYSSRQDNGESKFMDRWSGSSRQATVTGSASDGVIEYVAGNATASLFRLRAGQVVVASVLTALAANSALTAQSYTLQSRGDIGQAVLYVPLACGYRQLNVSVTDMMTKYGTGAPVPEKMVSIFGSDYDFCEEDARTYQGSAVLAAGDYEQSGVDAASLTKTVQVCGPNDCWDIALDLDWTGEGATASNSYISRQEIEGTTYISRWAGSNRNATLTGTATDASFDYMAGEAWATLHRIRSGSVTITK